MIQIYIFEKQFRHKKNGFTSFSTFVMNFVENIPPYNLNRNRNSVLEFFSINQSNSKALFINFELIELNLFIAFGHLILRPGKDRGENVGR